MTIGIRKILKFASVPLQTQESTSKFRTPRKKPSTPAIPDSPEIGGPGKLFFIITFTHHYYQFYQCLT